MRVSKLYYQWINGLYSIWFRTQTKYRPQVSYHPFYYSVLFRFDVDTIYDVTSFSQFLPLQRWIRHPSVFRRRATYLLTRSKPRPSLLVDIDLLWLVSILPSTFYSDFFICSLCNGFWSFLKPKMVFSLLFDYDVSSILFLY